MSRLIKPLVTVTGMRAFTLALLLVFLMRALIPIGYMPDVKQGRSSGFTISLCSTGLSAATVLALALDTEQTQTEHHQPYCAFASVLEGSAPPTDTYAFFAPALFSGLILPLLGKLTFFSWVVRGPPLGSRAPPVYRSTLFPA